MTVRTYLRTILLAALASISLGGFLLHARIHPVAQNQANLIPALSGLLSVIAIPLLFCFRRTLVWGYVLNGFTAIIGTVVMAHFSIARWPMVLLPDILILWGKFFVGKALFDLELFGYDTAHEKKGQSWRYPNLGWWLAHLAAFSLVYAVVKTLWR
jgi:hypothetical protein